MKNKLNLTIEELVTCTNGKVIKNNNISKINYIITDSREDGTDSLFIPLIGETHDGHKFLLQAYANNSRVFLIDEKHTMDKDDVTIIQVKDTTKALGDIARYHKSKFNINTVAVTGSVGKTTTKNMIYAVLNNKLNVLKNEGNLNNEIGVPKTILNLNNSYDVLISEMGLSYKGDISYYASIAKPNIAVISNIGTAHIGNFSNQEGIFHAKMEVCENFTSDDILIINGDDKYLSTVKDTNPIYQVKTYGFNENNDITCLGYEIDKDKIIFKAKISNKVEEFTIPSIAKHNIYNAMAAILVGLHLNLSISEIKEGLLKFQTEKGRLYVVELKNYLLIDDSYNASKDSMISSLDVLRNYNTRKVAILGDILEAGEYAHDLHYEVGKHLNDINLLVTVGENAKIIGQSAKEHNFQGKIYNYNDVYELINNYKNILNKDDTILVKSSHGMLLYKFVEHLENED